MRLFFKRLFIFIIIILIGFFLLLSITNRVISNGNYFSIPKEKTNLLLGHSHAACAFNDTIIKSLYNLSQNGEGYPYSYFKAKKILENNSHIKNIFIEFTNNQISPWAFNRIYGSYLPVNMSRTLPIVDNRFALKTVRQNSTPLEILAMCKATLKNNISFLLENENSYIKHQWNNYMPPKRIIPQSDIDNLKKTKKTAENHFKDLYSIQEENIRYLIELKLLCEQHHVNLYFVRSPFLATKLLDNEMVFEHILEHTFKDVQFLDFMKYPLTRKQFSDEQHVNINGRNDLSTFFNNQIILKGLLNHQNPENILEQKIDSLRKSHLHTIN